MTEENPAREIPDETCLRKLSIKAHPDREAFVINFNERPFWYNGVPYSVDGVYCRRCGEIILAVREELDNGSLGDIRYTRGVHITGEYHYEPQILDFRDELPDDSVCINEVNVGMKTKTMELFRVYIRGNRMALVDAAYVAHTWRSQEMGVVNRGYKFVLGNVPKLSGRNNRDFRKYGRKRKQRKKSG